MPRDGRICVRGELAGAHLLCGCGARNAGLTHASSSRAAGETVRKRTAEPAGDLTPRDPRTARLAWDGRTSPDISTQLFISPRPAAWHPPRGVRKARHQLS